MGKGISEQNYVTQMPESRTFNLELQVTVIFSPLLTSVSSLGEMLCRAHQLVFQLGCATTQVVWLSRGK